MENECFCHLVVSLWHWTFWSVKTIFLPTPWLTHSHFVCLLSSKLHILPVFLFEHDLASMVVDPRAVSSFSPSFHISASFLLWKDRADGSISKSSCNKSLQYVLDPLSPCKKLTCWCTCVVSVLLWQDRSWGRKLPRSAWVSSHRARGIKSEAIERCKQHRVWTMSHSHFLVSNTYHACAHWHTP